MKSLKSFAVMLVLGLVAVLAVPSVAVAGKPAPDPVPYCIDDVTGLPVKTNSPSGRCPPGSHEGTYNGISASGTTNPPPASPPDNPSKSDIPYCLALGLFVPGGTCAK